MQQGDLVDIRDRKLTSSKAVTQIMQPVFYNVVSTLTIYNCSFSNIHNNDDSGIFEGKGSGLSIRFGFGGNNYNFTSTINISSSEFTNCSNLLPNSLGGAFYISSQKPILGIYISDVNITGCNAFNGAAFIVDTKDQKSNLIIKNINIESCSNTDIGAFQTHTMMIYNSNVDFSYSYIEGISAEKNIISNHFFGLLYLENCTGKIYGIQFTNVYFNNTNGVIIKVTGKTTNISFSRICFSYLNSSGYFGIQAQDQSISITDFYYNRNFLNGSSEENYTYNSTDDTYECNTETDPPTTSTEVETTSDILDTTADTTSETSQVTSTTSSANETINETTAIDDNNNNNNNVRPLSDKDIGAIVGGVIAAIIVIILIIVIVICCKKKGCTCCERRAFKFSDDEDSSHQELYFPNFEAK